MNMKIKDKFYSTLDTLDKEEISLDWWLERYRNWRKEELTATDWTQLPDAPVDASAYATYRQALRDLPSVEDFANAELPKLLLG
jgi:hypothetical protein